MKILGRTLDEMLAYMNDGWIYRETFKTQEAAFQWFQTRTPSELSPPTIHAASTGQMGYAPRGSHASGGKPSGLGTPTAPPAHPMEGLFGLVSPDGTRTVAPSPDHVTFLEARGFTLTMSFASPEAAETWATSAAVTNTRLAVVTPQVKAQITWAMTLTLHRLHRKDGSMQLALDLTSHRPPRRCLVYM